MTSLTSFRPRTGLDLLRNDPFFRRILGDWDDELEQNGRTWAPALDLVEHPDSYEVRIDVPGIDPKDVELTLQNDVLVVRGERHTETEKTDDTGSVLRREVWSGRFERAVRLPGGIEAGKVKARGKDGVLTVTLPKAKEHIGRRIVVEG